LVHAWLHIMSYRRQQVTGVDAVRSTREGQKNVPFVIPAQAGIQPCAKMTRC
jgi:hypothetical protein